MALVPLPLGSYRNGNSVSRMVNCFAEAAPAGAKGPVTARRAPGIAPYVTCGVGPGRGLHVLGNSLYAVSGFNLYRVAATAYSVGQVLGSGPVHTADNGTQLAVSAGGSLYVMESGAVAQVADPDVLSPIGGIDFLDNYLIATRRGTGQWGCSALADFSDWDALDFATAESQPDDLVTVIADHRMAFLIGATSCELWDNQGGSGFPFARVVNGTVELGGIAEFGATKCDNSVFWLASDKTVRRLTGVTPEKVSQDGVERAIRGYSRVDDCHMSSYTLDGHMCVVLHFPTADATWVYDATTREWHEREGARYSGWDVADIASMNGTVYVQRLSTGEVGILSPSEYRQWNEPLRTEWTYQSIYDQGRDIIIHEVVVGCETGVGPADQSEPRVTLELSRTGGKGDWRAFPAKSLGAQGKRRTRLKWNRLGVGRNNVIRMSLDHPSPLTLWDTFVDAEPLR